ncbi:ABC transporter ATP-binding protein [Aureibaculum sp. A20]|uniref:ABC transporter ATP-binding protein n=1 Tax=Aureibaculum flavum TaxID=2795986 RepID=A0ABS0WU98_9FLAO|nr:Pycsar system effector family protein [Aureibaculum flavum]MBJ2175560.1 ABC transporter ATP-binding protein [Aureibaculum flavum]
MEIPEAQQNPPQIKNKHTDDLVDHYWGSINYIFNLIKASEIKAGLILSFYGILFNFIYKSFASVSGTDTYHTFLYILLGLWLICTIISVYFCIRCFMPRIETKFDKNIFFFGDVITKFGDIKQFSKLFHEISKDEDRLFDQLGQQVYINSKIAALKFKNVNRALRFLALGLVFLFIIITYYAIVFS